MSQRLWRLDIDNVASFQSNAIKFGGFKETPMDVRCYILAIRPR